MINILLLLILVIFAIAAVQMRDLLSVTIILGAYSLIMAVVWTRLNAVDVAFTEASVGAGITTVLLLAALSRTQRGEEEEEKTKVQKKYSLRGVAAFLISIFICGMLIYGTMDLPNYGDPNAPAQTHVAPRYIEKSHEEAGVINFVTAILASYRGYDTLGETTVIFTAGTSVILLLRRKKR